MPGGLQCWDANGKLVIDIGDYNTRYLGRTTAFLPANVSSVTGSFPELTQAGGFVVVASTLSASYFTPGDFAARALNSGFGIFRLSRNTAAVTLLLDMYAFL